MSKEILLLGEFSTGKSAFINMLLGVSILPERLESTDIPIIKIHSSSPSGIWLREHNQKNSKAIDKFTEIPKDWNAFEYAEITIPQHPLLSGGLVFWDTPGINSNNPHHQKHLNHFINESHRNFKQIYFFIHGNITATSINYIKQLKKYWDKLNILINIKEIRSEKECRLIENEVKKTVRLQLGNIPVDLLYWGDLCEELNLLSENNRIGLSDWELIKDWDKRKIDILELRKKYHDTLIGEQVFDIITDIANEKILSQQYYMDLDFKSLENLSNNFDPKAQFYLADRYATVLGDFRRTLELYKSSADNGYDVAQYELAQSYKLGFFGQKNSELYLEYLQMAVVNNNKNAIAEQYFEGINTIINPQIGFSILKNAADNDDINVYEKLAECYSSGLGCEVNMENAEHYMRLVGRTEPYKLGGFLVDSEDEIKVTEGVEILTQCIRNKISIANFSLASHYLKDKSNIENLNKAFVIISGLEGKNFMIDSLLADCYYNGWGVIANEEKAFQLYKQIYDDGFHLRLNELSECYKFGIGTPQDIDQAIKLLRISSEAGNDWGTYKLAMILIEYEESSKEGERLLRNLSAEGFVLADVELAEFYLYSDPKVALDYLLPIESYDFPRVNTLLGKLYLNSEDLDPQNKKAFHYLTKAANQEMSEAQNLLGLCYQNGWGTVENGKKAFEFVKMAAMQDLAVAQSNLAYYYLNGIGVNENETEAFKWFNEAAKHGNSTAQYYLGMFYLNGNVVAENHKEAFRLFLLAAEQGDSDAQNMVGRCYEEGWGTYKNEQKAFKWQKLSADNGNAIGQYNLATSYANGIGCDEDYNLAFQYFKASAQQGYSDAQYYLGTMYENGLGVIRDFNQAWYWYEQAADQGNEEAINAINELSRINKRR